MDIIRLLDSGQVAAPELEGKPWHEFKPKELFARRARPKECLLLCEDGAQQLIDIEGKVRDAPLTWSHEELNYFTDCIPAKYRIVAPLTLERIN